MIMYFAALWVLDIAFLLGCIYMVKCHKTESNSDGSGEGFFLLVVGIGFIITSIVIASSGYNLAN